MQNIKEAMPGKAEYFLGIDGGGTKCKAVIVSQDNQVLGTGISGPGNPLHGFEQATSSIVESAHLALQNSGLSAHLSLKDLTAGVGLAGVNLQALFEQMNHWQHPFKQMFLATDFLIACLGAHQGEDGAVIITGTGSCGYSYVNHQSFMIGGHGSPYGDICSGAWLGLEACKYVLLSLDGIIDKSLLTPLILRHLNIETAPEMVEVIAHKPAAFFAQMAWCVFQGVEQNDPVATSILKQGADYISNVVRQLLKNNPPNISLIGGLSGLIKPWLADDIQGLLTEPQASPEWGAILFAQQRLKNTNVYVV